MNIYNGGYEIITLTVLKKQNKNQILLKVSIDHSNEDILMKY